MTECPGLIAAGGKGAITAMSAKQALRLTKMPGVGQQLARSVYRFRGAIAAIHASQGFGGFYVGLLPNVMQVRWPTCSGLPALLSAPLALLLLASAPYTLLWSPTPSAPNKTSTCFAPVAYTVRSQEGELMLCLPVQHRHIPRVATDCCHT